MPGATAGGASSAFASPRDRLASRRHDDTEIIGLEGYLDMFLGLPVGSAPGPPGATP